MAGQPEGMRPGKEVAMPSDFARNHPKPEGDRSGETARDHPKPKGDRSGEEN